MLSMSKKTRPAVLELNPSYGSLNNIAPRGSLFGTTLITGLSGRYPAAPRQFRLNVSPTFKADKCTVAQKTKTTLETCACGDSPA